MSTKEKLIESFIDLISRDKYINLRVEDITKNAGVAKGSFYTYFSSKNDIFIEIFRIKVLELEEKIKVIPYKKNCLKKNIQKFISILYFDFLNNRNLFIVLFMIFQKQTLQETFIRGESFFKNVKKRELIKIIELSKEEIREEIYENKTSICFGLESLLNGYLVSVFKFNPKVKKVEKIGKKEFDDAIKIITNLVYFSLKK